LRLGNILIAVLSHVAHDSDDLSRLVKQHIRCKLFSDRVFIGEESLGHGGVDDRHRTSGL
jgi:hypothetical protein